MISPPRPEDIERMHHPDPKLLAEAFRQYRKALELDWWERKTGKRRMP